MLFTYKDKGPATVFTYPSNQRPMTKHNTIHNIPGKPNPIKQWRKQLTPSVGSPVQSHPTISALDNATKTDNLESCKGYNDIIYNNDCKGITNEDNANEPNCITGTYQIKRSANTIINKDFYWNSKQYLYNRCKTFDQNQTRGRHISGNEYYSGSCVTDDNGNVCKPLIHKPNNKAFKQQGGVSSSSRIAKLKYDTIRNSTNKYDSLLANLDSSSHVLNRKPTPCRGWRVRGKRPYSADCNHTLSFSNI
jgi:hypothetical protein